MLVHFPARRLIKDTIRPSKTIMLSIELRNRVNNEELMAYYVELRIKVADEETTSNIWSSIRMFTPIYANSNFHSIITSIFYFISRNQKPNQRKTFILGHDKY